jgi:HPt (histidine-containing phosphotransfer) domain-containing protein
MMQTAMDESAYQEMKSMMGDAYRDVIDLCLQTFPQQLSQIHDGINDNNADSVFAAAHRLKSACGSIGAYGLAERAEAVELHARDGSADIPATALNALETAITEVTDFLQQELA